MKNNEKELNVLQNIARADKLYVDPSPFQVEALQGYFINRSKIFLKWIILEGIEIEGSTKSYYMYSDDKKVFFTEEELIDLYLNSL